MNKVLTVAEIKSKYDSEWVLIEDPQTNEALEVQSGRGVYHSKDRDEFDRKALGFHPKRFAVVYTGNPPEGMEFALRASLSVRTRAWLLSTPRYGDLVYCAANSAT